MSEISDQAALDWPFDIWLRLAVLHMGLSPQEFWAMDMRDWFALCHRSTPVQFGQADLETLLKAYPDKLASKKDNELWMT